MEYQLDVQSAKIRDGEKYKVIQITDIALHTSKKTTSNDARKVTDAFRTNKPGRLYHEPPATQVKDDKKKYVMNLLKMDADFMKMVHEENAKGYKVLVALPKDGIPVVFGKDTIEFFNSKNGKRLIRGLAKGDTDDKIV